MKIWILFLCALAVGVSAQSDESANLDWDDEWKEYDDEWFRQKLEQLGIYNDEQKDSAENRDTQVGNIEKDQDEMDFKVEEEIEQFREAEDDDEKNDDYQFEDNRSEQREQLGDDEKVEPIHDIGDEINQDTSLSESNVDYDYYALNVEDDLEPNVPESEDLEITELKFSKDDDIVSLPEKPTAEIQRIMDEAQAIINSEVQKSNDFSEDEAVQENSQEYDKIMEETKTILDEENKKVNDFADAETIPKDEDLSKVLEEAQNDSKDGEVINQDEGKNTSQEALDNPEVADEIDQVDGKSKEVGSDLGDSIVDEDEDTVDKVYEDLNEDLDKLFETIDKLSKSENEDDEKVKSADVDYAVNDDDSLEDKSDYENVFDSNLSDLFAEHSKAKAAENELEAIDEKDDEQNKDTKKVEESAEQVLEEVPYINDALISEDKSDEKPAVKSINVDDLSDDQLVQLMKDFEIQHSDVFDVEAFSDDHVVNEITLEYGETKVITSDNYPAAYPTNRIVDWIVAGNGQGIELNLTDFAVNSAVGDYLMVKPGQVDDSGADGIIFAYHLNEPRAFRFTDVDRVFIRFDSKLGMSWMRGFSLTLKVIAPPAQEPEPEPEPEPLLPEPRHTLTVLLGGLTLVDFDEISEDFRKLVADMATMYINAKGVEPGMNTTAEITQIISASTCKVQWPGFEKCAQVKVSVPLVYEEDEGHRLNEADLQSMWQTYVDMDPFAARLRQMGIEEFSVPNDGGVLTVWLVVALGVLVSAAILAFTLWRYTCFEDYSRMPAYSDTDSLHEKRNSALYPTPHQMLPPLYAEKDYDSARVDMGGYTNRSYSRADLYDQDSDEDAVPRDRNAGIQPRDIFSV